MKDTCSVDDILDFAIGEEEKAMNFYSELATSAHPAMKAVFEGFAVEEAGHKKKLQAVKDGGNFNVLSQAQRCTGRVRTGGTRDGFRAVALNRNGVRRSGAVSIV